MECVVAQAGTLGNGPDKILGQKGVDGVGTGPAALRLGRAGPQKVVLIKPPMQVARGSHLTLACPPLGIAYLAASLREAGVEVSVVDGVGEAPDQVRPVPGRPGKLSYGLTDEQIVSRIPKDTTIIGVSSMFTEEWPLARSVLRAVIRACPHAVVVAGGENVSAAPDLVLRECPGLAACIIGEGEETLVELVQHIAEGKQVEWLPGLAFPDPVHGLRKTPRRQRISKVDDIPWPAWDLLPMEEYLSRGLGYGVKRGRSVPILASRGCPFSCSFCSSPKMWTTRWTARDPHQVIAEMEHGVEYWGAQNFDFYDLTAIVRKDWIVKFCKLLIAKNWDVTWQIPAGTRSEALDEEVVGLLYQAGCRNVAYAPESGSLAVLDRIKKRVKLERMMISMEAAIKAGLKVKCNMVMGFPDETPAEMLDTVRFCADLARLGVHDVNVTPFCPYPGSELFDSLLESGKIPALDERYFDMLASYSDLSKTASFSDHVNSLQLGALRWGAMLVFYGTSFGTHPSRGFSLVSNLARGRQTTRLERALSDIIERQAVGLRSLLPKRWRAKGAQSGRGRSGEGLRNGLESALEDELEGALEYGLDDGLKDGLKSRLGNALRKDLRSSLKRSLRNGRGNGSEDSLKEELGDGSGNGSGDGSGDAQIGTTAKSRTAPELRESR